MLCLRVIQVGGCTRLRSLISVRGIRSFTADRFAPSSTTRSGLTVGVIVTIFVSSFHDCLLICGKINRQCFDAVRWVTCYTTVPCKGSVLMDAV